MCFEHGKWKIIGFSRDQRSGHDHKHITRMGKEKTLLSRNHPVDNDPDDYYVT